MRIGCVVSGSVCFLFLRFHLLAPARLCGSLPVLRGVTKLQMTPLTGRQDAVRRFHWQAGKPAATWVSPRLRFTPSLEQGGKTGLLEVMIAGQRFGQPLIVHHRERNAIGQRPFLVRAVEEGVGENWFHGLGRLGVP